MNPSANAGDERDIGLIPRSRRSPGEGNGNSLQYSCLENSMDKGTWQSMGLTKHGIWLGTSTYACNVRLTNPNVKFIKERILSPILLRPALRNTRRRHHEKIKLQTNIPHGQRCKNSKQNFSKLNTTINKNENIYRDQTEIMSGMH